MIRAELTENNSTNAKPEVTDIDVDDIDHFDDVIIAITSSTFIVDVNGVVAPNNNTLNAASNFFNEVFDEIIEREILSRFPYVSIITILTPKGRRRRLNTKSDDVNALDISSLSRTLPKSQMKDQKLEAVMMEITKTPNIRISNEMYEKHASELPNKSSIDDIIFSILENPNMNFELRKSLQITFPLYFKFVNAVTMLGVIKEQKKVRGKKLNSLHSESLSNRSKFRTIAAVIVVIFSVFGMTSLLVIFAVSFKRKSKGPILHIKQSESEASTAASSFSTYV